MHYQKLQSLCPPVSVIQQMKSSCPGQELEQLHYHLSCRKTLSLLPLVLQSTPLHHDPVTHPGDKFSVADALKNKINQRNLA
jgi:hypothetical protein